MLNSKDNIKNNRISKKNRCWFLVFLAVFSIFFISETLNAVGQTYNIVLPQRVDGVEKLEYAVNAQAQGSTDGKTSIDPDSGARIYFLVKIESARYTQLLAKNVKIVSEKGTVLSLKVFEYDERGNLDARDVTDDELIDPQQTYTTSIMTVKRDESLSIQGVTPDKFDAGIKLENTETAINEVLSVTYSTSGGNFVPAEFNGADNLYVIKNITINESLKIKVDAASAYSQSQMAFLCSDLSMNKSAADESLFIPEVTSNIDITVQNMSKNKYGVSFTKYPDASFKYKKSESADYYEDTPNEGITVTHGDKCYFTCEATGGSTLSGREITANGITVRAVNGVYSLTDISENLTVAITDESSSLYEIKLLSSEAVAAVTDTLGNKLKKTAVKYGELFEFKISPTAAYTQNADYALVYAVPQSKLANDDYDTQSNIPEANSYLLTPSYGGVFTLQSVKEPMAIILKNLDINTYKITLPQTVSEASYAVTLSDYVKQISENKYTVVHGRSMEITMTPKPGKSVSDLIFENDGNIPLEVSKNRNVYTIENITNNADIVISNITAASHEVKFAGEGIICKDENGNIFNNKAASIIYETGTVKFQIEPEEGYEIGPNGINVSLESGSAVLSMPPEGSSYYTLSNATENTVLKVTGTVIKTVTVSLITSMDSVNFVSASESSEILPSDNTVDYGSDFEFKVVSALGEDVPDVKVATSDGTEAAPLGNSTYSLPDVSHNLTAVITPFEESSILSTSSAPNIQKWKLASESEIVTDPPESPFEKTVKKNTTQDENHYISYKDTIPGQFEISCDFKYDPPYSGDKIKGFKLSYYDEFGTEQSLSPENGQWSYSDGTTTISLTVASRLSDNAYTNTLSASISIIALITNLNGYKYSDAGLGGKLDSSVLSIFGKIYATLEYEAVTTMPPQQITTINFDPPPRGAKYHQPELGAAAGSSTTYIGAGEELGDLSYDHRFDEGDYIFAVRLDAKYKMDDGAVKVRPESGIKLQQLKDIPNTIIAENVYIYKLSQSTTPAVRIYIEEEGIKLKTYNASFSGYGTNFRDGNGDQFLSKTFNYNDSFKFTTLPKEGYKKEVSLATIIVNGKEYTISGGETQTDACNIKYTTNPETAEITYELSAIKGDFSIRVARQRLQFNITFPQLDGVVYYEVSGGNETLITENVATADYEFNFSFIVSAKNGYDTSGIVVTSNHEILDLINGKYTIRGITSDKTIRVENIKKFSYKVTFGQYEGVIFKDTDNNTISETVQVNYGDEVHFKTILSPAYSNSVISIHAEYSSGIIKEFESSDIENKDPKYNESTKIYTITVNENIRIYAENMTFNTYNVKLEKAQGITYYNQYGTEPLQSLSNEEPGFIFQNVTYGNNLSFKVVADEGYDISNLKVYSKKASAGSPQTQILSANEIYTIENITESYTVTTENISKSSYQIEFRIVEGGRCIDDHAKEIGNIVTVSHGSNYSFKVSLDSAYNNSVPAVTVKGTNLNIIPNADKVYTLENIKSNKIIEIINITKNSYKATFKAAEGVVYKTAKNKIFEGTQDVEYGDALYFKVSLLDAYDKSYPWVQLNGEKTLIENGGIYNLENIRDNVEIIVKNVFKNPEEVTMDDVNNVPENVISIGDVDSVIKATLTYNGLTDEQKEQVLSIAKLEEAQRKAGEINHKAGDILVSGLSWNIKLIVNDLNGDEEKISEFSEKIDRRSVLSLYEIYLVDVLTDKVYEVPYGQKVTVVMPIPDLTGYKNTVIAHENSVGSIEYLDVNITEKTGQFETSSFSLFGVAAKKIPNYVENPSDLAISISSLVDNTEELQTLLGEGLVSQLGNLIDDSEGDAASSAGSTTGSTTGGTMGTQEAGGTSGDDSSESSDSFLSSISNQISAGINGAVNAVNFSKAYDWALDNELISVILILVIGSILIAIIIIISKRQNKKS